MKNLLFALTLALLFSNCQKETSVSKEPGKVEEIAAANTPTIITYQIPNNIKTYVVHGNVETITLNNNVVIVRTKDASNPNLFHIVRTQSARKEYYNQVMTVTGNITNSTLFLVTGEKIISVDIDQTGHINITFIDRNIGAWTCLGAAINSCTNHFGCSLLCSLGGWGPCILGWSLECERRAVGGQV